MSIEEQIEDLDRKISTLVDSFDDLANAFCKARGHNFEGYPYHTHCALCGASRPKQKA